MPEIFGVELGYAALGGAAGVIVLTAQVSAPALSPEERYGGGTYEKYPGFHNIDAATFTFYETWDMQVTRYLEAWGELVKNKSSGHYGLPYMYKKSIITEFYGPVSDTAPSMTVKLNKAWPSLREGFSLNYTESANITVTGTFSVSNYEIM